MLHWLDKSQVLYCDTDSVFFVYDSENKKHKYPDNEITDIPENVKFGSYFANFKINCLLSWTHHTLFMKMMLRRAKVQGISKYF